MWASAILVMIALPLQLLGISGTCTQGADGPFLTGAILSAPFLVIAAGLALGAWLKRRRDLTAIAAAGVSTILLLFLCSSAWSGVLFFRTPCGPNFADYPTSEVGGFIILIGYLVLPMITLVAVALSLFGPRQPS